MQIIMRRRLKDYDAWKKMASTYGGMRREHGSQGGVVYRNAKDPTEVYLIFDWDDRKPFRTYFDRPDVQKALAETGTTEIIEVSESFRLVE